MERIKTRPCPYCGRRLQAQNKLKWRNNLARHLGRGTCLPYEAEKPRMAMMGAFIGNFLGALVNGRIGELVPVADPKRQSDIAELEKLYRATASTDQTPTDQPEQKDSHQS